MRGQRGSGAQCLATQVTVVATVAGEVLALEVVLGGVLVPKGLGAERAGVATSGRVACQVLRGKLVKILACNNQKRLFKLIHIKKKDFFIFKKG